MMIRFCAVSSRKRSELSAQSWKNISGAFAALAGSRPIWFPSLAKEGTGVVRSKESSGEAGSQSSGRPIARRGVCRQGIHRYSRRSQTSLLDSGDAHRNTDCRSVQGHLSINADRRFHFADFRAGVIALTRLAHSVRSGIQVKFRALWWSRSPSTRLPTAIN